MRLLAFILFFAGSILCIDSLVTLAEVTPEEAFLLARVRSGSLPEDIAELRVLQNEFSKAKKARLLWFARNAIASGSLFLLGVVLLMKRPPFKHPAAVFVPPPQPPDLATLLGAVKRQPYSRAACITHFYESRRARCRAARERLKSKINLLFETSATTSEDHPAH